MKIRLDVPVKASQLKAGMDMRLYLIMSIDD